MRRKRNRPYPPYYDKSLVKTRDQFFAAFDTETEGLGGKLLLITWAVVMPNEIDGQTIESGIIDGSPDDMLAGLISIMEKYYAHTWYAHNAQYDWRYVMQYIKDHKLDHQIFMRTKTDIYQIKLFLDADNKNGWNEITMRDSMAFWPGRLSDLLKHYAPDLPKLTIDDIAHFDPTREDHREYALRDSVGLAIGMSNLDAMVREQYGIGIKGTTASTALSAWEKQVEQRYYINETSEDFVREAYFGGIVFLTNTRVNANLETYDINSSYPYQMRKYPVPYGRSFHTTEYHPDKLGIYRVKLKTHNVTLPCIPKRLENGRIIWPVGEFEAVTTNIELEFAILHGYEILDIIDGLVFEETINPFAKFVDTCERIRQSFRGMPQEGLAKLMQNALYGKYGSRRERVTMFVPQCDEDIIGAEPWDDEQFWWVKTERQDMRCMPSWAVFITARARLHLLRSAYSVGIENVVYGDTDSLTIRQGCAESLDIGNAYGQFKLEKEWSMFRAIAPKVYVGKLSKDFKSVKVGSLYGAAKGLPEKALNQDHWQGLLDGREIKVSYDTLSSLKVFLRRDTIGTAKAGRKSSNIERSLSWEGDNYGNVKPRLYREG